MGLGLCVGPDEKDIPRRTKAPSTSIGIGTCVRLTVATHPLPLPQQRREPAHRCSVPSPARAPTTPTRSPFESMNHAPSAPPVAVRTMPFLCPGLRGVVLLELRAATPRLFDGNADVADLND
jgi:hypothetical protein